MWYHALPTTLSAYAIFDWMPNSRDLAITRQAAEYTKQDFYNSYLYVISPTGEVQSEYANKCETDARNFNMFNHECRVESTRARGADDDATTTTRVLTLAYALRDGLGNATALSRLDSTMGAQWASSEGANASVEWVGDRLIAWTPDPDGGEGSVKIVYDLMDYFDPRRIEYATDAYGWMTATCDGGEGKLKAVEWFHASSASQGVADNYLVTSRNLDALVSLASDGTGVQWVLAADPSWARALGYETLTFDGGDVGGGGGGSASHARFFQVRLSRRRAARSRGRAAREETPPSFPPPTQPLSSPRPRRSRTTSCSTTSTTCCSSTTARCGPTARRPTRCARASAARSSTSSTSTRAPRRSCGSLSTPSTATATTRAATTTRARPPTTTTRSARAREEEWDIFNTAGGSVAKMDNGYYFVAFNAAEVSEGTEGSHPTLAFEVTPKGHARSKVRLPRISVGCGSYRTLTSDSVYFESEESTLNATTTDDV